MCCHCSLAFFTLNKHENVYTQKNTILKHRINQNEKQKEIKTKKNCLKQTSKVEKHWMSGVEYTLAKKIEMKNKKNITKSNQKVSHKFENLTVWVWGEKIN